MKKLKNILTYTLMLMILMINMQFVYAVEIPADGEYEVNINFAGGTGRVTAESPMEINVADGKITGTIVLTSSNYTYMIVDGTKYNNSAELGKNSTFMIPIQALDTDLDIVACTEAMSMPQEIEYVINISSEGTNSIKNTSEDIKEVVTKPADAKENNFNDSTNEKPNENLETKVDEAKTEELEKKEEVIEVSKEEAQESEETTEKVENEDSIKSNEKDETAGESTVETKEKSNNTIFVFLGAVIIGGIGVIIYKKRNK